MTTTLTGNEVALAIFGLGHMENFLKTLPGGKFRRREIANARALRAKLSTLLDAHTASDRRSGIVIDGRAIPGAGDDDGENIVLREAPIRKRRPITDKAA